LPLAAVFFLLVAMLVVIATPGQSSGASGVLYTFDGAPANPVPFNPADWDVAGTSRDQEIPLVTDPALLSAAELSSLYAARDLSPVEATQASLARIERLNPQLNAFCGVHGDEALAAARQSEARWQQVTVSGATCLDADVAAKAAFLLGDDGPDWLDERGLPGRFLCDYQAVTNRSWRGSLEGAPACI
jgi:hypothetical protein